jgi:hypothetical protein
MESPWVVTKSVVPDTDGGGVVLVLVQAAKNPSESNSKPRCSTDNFIRILSP